MKQDEHPEIFVGCTGYQPHGAGSFRKASLMEIQESFVAPPRASTLHKWRERAPADFAFVARCWQVVTHGTESPSWGRLPKREQFQPSECGFFRATEAVRQGYERMLSLVEALGARALLFDTPASFTPTSENRRLLSAFFGSVRRAVGVDYVWQARGIWAAAEVAAICADLQLVAAVDPISAEMWPEGSVAYVRLGGVRYDEAALGRIATGVLRYDRAYCVLTAPDPFRTIRQLATEISESQRFSDGVRID